MSEYGTVLAYLIILSRIPSGYKQTDRRSRHCLQLGVSPLHLVFLKRHDSHARRTRLPSLGATFERCRGIAIFAFPWSILTGELLDTRLGCTGFDIIGDLGKQGYRDLSLRNSAVVIYYFPAVLGNWITLYGYNSWLGILKHSLWTSGQNILVGGNPIKIQGDDIQVIVTFSLVTAREISDVTML